MDDKQEKAKGKETPTELILLSSRVRWKEFAAGDQKWLFGRVREHDEWPFAPQNRIIPGRPWRGG
jgi:hypothetical protein